MIKICNYQSKCQKDVNARFSRQKCNFRRFQLKKFSFSGFLKNLTPVEEFGRLGLLYWAGKRLLP